MDLKKKKNVPLFLTHHFTQPEEYNLVQMKTKNDLFYYKIHDIESREIKSRNEFLQTIKKKVEKKFLTKTESIYTAQ